MSMKNTQLGVKVSPAIGQSYDKIVNFFKTEHKKTLESYIQKEPIQSLKLYAERQYERLARSDLRQPIDQTGDTMAHLLASLLDKEAFEKIKRYNPKALQDIINKPNNKGELPIHKAVQAVKNHPEYQAFITYMIEKLGADPKVPDEQGRVVVEVMEGTNENVGDESITGLNQRVMQNLRSLLGKTRESTCVLEKVSTTSKPNNPDLDFIRKLTEYYQNPAQSGGYRGKRQIKNYFSDIDLTESGSHDSFVSSKKKKLLNDLSKKENGSANQKRVQKRFTDKWSTEEFNLFSSPSNVTKSYNDDDDEEMDEAEVDITMGYPEEEEMDIEAASSLNRPRSRFPRDPKIDEIYRSFLQKLMDTLGIDEETARIYRVALKMTIEEEHPELRGRENDALKVREMEKLINDEKKLRKASKKIDIEEVKRRIEERRKETEERRKAFRERRPRTETTTTSEEVTTDKTKEKPKRTKKSNKMTEGGYLQSDEIIFSP